MLKPTQNFYKNDIDLKEEKKRWRVHYRQKIFTVDKNMSKTCVTRRNSFQNCECLH